MAYDVAELSALRWLIDEFGRQHVDLVTENQSLRQESALCRPFRDRRGLPIRGVYASDQAHEGEYDLKKQKRWQDYLRSNPERPMKETRPKSQGLIRLRGLAHGIRPAG